MSEPTLTWEDIDSIDSTGRLVSKRTKIPAGWLVWVAQAAPLTGAPLVAGLTLVPDPEHNWDGNQMGCEPAARDGVFQ